MKRSVCSERLGARRCGGVLIEVMCLIAAFVTVPSGWAESTDVEVRLQKIRLEVSQTEKTIGVLKSEFAKLKREEKTLNSELQVLIAAEADLTKKSADTTQRKEKLTLEVEVAEKRVVEQQALIRDRLRALYLHSAVDGQPRYVRMVMKGDLERTAVYARSVRMFDSARFQDVKKVVDSLIRARDELEATLRESLRIQGELQTKRTELEAKRLTLQGVMKAIKEKQQVAQQSLGTLRIEAAKIEELLHSITSDEGVVRPEVVPSPVTSLEPGSAPLTTERDGALNARTGDVQPQVKVEDVMHPEGLFGKGVRVSYPIKGQVLRSFGRSKVTDFSDIIFSKGMEFKTAESSQVKSVLGGRVAFSGVMPGFDMVVIIDHGLRSYSLYGRLGKVFVAKGDLVKRGAVVGVTAAPDAKGRNFYFETRKNGNPVDPSTVLSRAS